MAGKKGRRKLTSADLLAMDRFRIVTVIPPSGPTRLVSRAPAAARTSRGSPRRARPGSQKGGHDPPE